MFFSSKRSRGRDAILWKLPMQINNKKKKIGFFGPKYMKGCQLTHFTFGNIILSRKHKERNFVQNLKLY